MRRFTIGEWYDRSLIGTAENAAQMERLKQEIREKLGVQDGVLSYFAPYEVIEYKGTFYLRDKDTEPDAFTALSEWRSEYSAPGDGVVMCECTGKAFSITYGGYACYGKCVACGEEYELYSG